MNSVRALILGAGRGKRMRPLSDSTPKPLLRFQGKRMIDWQIDALIRAGVRDFVVNTAHPRINSRLSSGTVTSGGSRSATRRKEIPKKRLKPSAASPRRSRFFLLMA